MRSNVLQTLLVAFILIVGWTLFTIYQDITNVPGKLNRGVIVQRTKMYLPLPANSDSQSLNRTYPVYKPSAGNDSKGYIRNNSVTNSPNGGSLFSSSAFDISNSSAGNSTASMMDQPVQGNFGRNKATGSNASTAYPAISIQPFSRKGNGGLTALLDRNSESNDLSGPNASLSGSEPRFKAFGDPNDDDPIESGGGNENPNAYNDVPVGEGIFFLLFLLVLYAAFIITKKEKIIHNDHQ
jgi:hypothetical protein